MPQTKTIPVIDLFAGSRAGRRVFVIPDNSGHQPFRITLSIEKDRYAHQTLELRSFFRQCVPGAVPEDYYNYLRNADVKGEFYAH
jgi:DNA (cytosine-5)-methyltransferase 1